jgi:uncharacterized membrane protein YidH (DUF202 family)
MGLRLRQTLWQRQIRRWFTNPVTGILALVAVVLVAVATLVTVEGLFIRSPHVPLVFSPK